MGLSHAEFLFLFGPLAPPLYKKKKKNQTNNIDKKKPITNKKFTKKELINKIKVIIYAAIRREAKQWTKVGPMGGGESLFRVGIHFRVPLFQLALPQRTAPHLFCSLLFCSESLTIYVHFSLVTFHTLQFNTLSFSLLEFLQLLELPMSFRGLNRVTLSISSPYLLLSTNLHNMLS